MVIRFFLAHLSASEGSDHYNYKISAASGRLWGRLLAPLRRRLSATLMPLMLASPGDPTVMVDPVVPHMAGAAESGCLSLERGAQGQAAAFSPGDRSAGSCATTALPLVNKTMLGSTNLFSSDLEFSNMDFGQMTAQEVALKFGVGRDLPVVGMHASFDGSVGRVLGNFSPVLDEQLHATFTRPLMAHWDTGLEARLASLGALGPVAPTERSGLMFLRGRYKLASGQGEEQNLELKLTADSWQSTAQMPSRHARADVRYEYRRDSNVLSIGVNAIDTAQSVGPATPSVGINLRASRRF